jgi:hypothetical protein
VSPGPADSDSVGLRVRRPRIMRPFEPESLGRGGESADGHAGAGSRFVSDSDYGLGLVPVSPRSVLPDSESLGLGPDPASESGWPGRAPSLRLGPQAQ